MSLRNVVIAFVILLLATALLPIFAAMSARASKARTDNHFTDHTATQPEGMPQQP